MASRKMTFTIPEELAARFLHSVPSRERSRYVTDAIVARLREREERMIVACEVANNNADVAAIEQDWDRMMDETDRIEEPWNIAPAR